MAMRLQVTPHPLSQPAELNEMESRRACVTLARLHNQPLFVPLTQLWGMECASSVFPIPLSNGWNLNVASNQLHTCRKRQRSRQQQTSPPGLFTTGLFPRREKKIPYSLSHCIVRSLLQQLVWAQSLSKPHGLQPTRLLCPWDSPSKNFAVGCHFILQGIFPTQGLNP